jgi:thioredoxin 1
MYPGDQTMRKNKSILIIVALVAAIAVTFALKNSSSKQQANSQKDSPLPAPSEKQPPAQVSQSTGETDLKQSIPKLIDLGADKCIPCKKMAPILAELKTAYTGKFEVEFIDVWKNPDRGGNYKLRVIPTQIFFAPDGKELFRHEGYFSREDILAKWKELVFDMIKGNV